MTTSRQLPSKRRLRFGMVGGGRGAFIGAVHRLASQMDGEAELVAGCFSAAASRSRASGADLFLDPRRVYADYSTMARTESARPTHDRLDFVVIVTPNHAHFAPAKLFLESGFHVVLDKPATLDLAEARRLATIVRRTGRIFALTHNYSGHPMVKQARDFVRTGRLGRIRKVVVEYPQDWLASRLEATGQKQAAWRTDPARAGAAGCVGDIGTHAEQLARFVTGLQLRELCADLTSFVPGRRVADDASILLRFHGGAKGVLHASQVSVGEENHLSLRVYGEKAGLEWHLQSPDELRLKFPDRPTELWRRGHRYTSTAAQTAARIPPGHPEGYLEAFANIYRQIFRAIRAGLAGRPLHRDIDFPGIDDALRGMIFIDAVLRSARRGARWQKLPPVRAS